MTQPILIDQEGPIAKLTLNRPKKKNALNQTMLDALRAALLEVRDRPSVRAILLQGADGVFSSGIDQSLLMEAFQKSQEVPFRHIHHDLQDTFDMMERTEKPIIAVLSSYCMGLGLELALACDFRICTADCILGLPEIAFGLIPDVGGTTRLVRAVGVQRAKRMILTGGMITGRKAAQIGLTDTVPDQTTAEKEALALAEQLAELPGTAVGLAKVAVLHAAELDAGTSRKMEGWLQSILMKEPSLADNFMKAKERIQARIAAPEDV